MTYTELANYYHNFIHPWLISTLKIVNRTGSTTPGQMYTSSIVNNPDAKAIADEIYFQTFGVPAVAPSDIYDFNTGQAKPVKRVTPNVGVEPQNTNPTSIMQKVVLQEGSQASILAQNGGELNPNLTGTGNLSLVYRPIETREDIENTFSIKFIPIAPGNYNSTVIQYSPQALTNSTLLEPGASEFLDYDPLFNISGLTS